MCFLTVNLKRKNASGAARVYTVNGANTCLWGFTNFLSVEILGLLSASNLTRTVNNALEGGGMLLYDVHTLKTAVNNL